MAQLAWLQLCERAFRDDCDRLCIIGLITRLPVPTLPIAVHQLTLAGRVVEVRPGDEIEVARSISTPSGLYQSPGDPDCLDISNVGEYVLITMRQFPLNEEGMYRFAISLGEGDPLVIDVPVLLVSSVMHAAVH